MFDFVLDFIDRYYLSSGYNIVNTVTYGLVLGYIIYKMMPFFRRLLVNVDRSLVLMLVPFILFGSTGRELIDQDIGLYAGNTSFPQNYLFVSPGIYFTMFFLTLGCIFAGLLLQKIAKLDYHLTTAFLGWILFLYNFSLIASKLTNLYAFGMVLFFFMLSALLAYVLKLGLKLDFLGFEYNFGVILVHLLDASTTYVGVDFLGHIEKHVVPTLFIDVTGTAAVMYVLKLAVLIPALYYIDDELKDDVFSRRFTKLVIVILGAGPAIRNSTLLLMG
ncbi:MAG: DUF63 family protein [Candidatus Altiarchaeota archaeon]|nr:DUF63 family protein [Candidatus Altiarchaeota archaeon]